MFRISGVVKHLLIINVLMYFGTLFLLKEPGGNMMRALIGMQETEFWSWGKYILALFYPTSEYFRPYQLVTHMFMHGNLTHLFFNMFALFMFGPAIEARMGDQKFLLYYFITGFGAMALHLGVQMLEFGAGLPAYNANIPMLGASGAIFGVLTAYGMLFPDNKIMLLFPPIPMKAKYMVILFAAFELFAGLGPFKGDGVAHFAHLGGALFGFLLILYWRKSGKLF
ncbi:MAG: rhomboid family intramembrane serine protease [Saprospiraceae bacterium]